MVTREQNSTHDFEFMTVRAIRTKTKNMLTCVLQSAVRFEGSVRFHNTAFLTCIYITIHIHWKCYL